jgi:serine/threonine protein kinase
MAHRDINSTDSTAPLEPDAETRMATWRAAGDRDSTPDSTDITGAEVIPDEQATRLAGSLSLSPLDAPPLPQQTADTTNSEPSRLVESGRRAHEPARQSQVVGVGSVLKERFVLEEIIARGGMGVIYKARDLRKEEFKDRKPYVAVKLLGEDCNSNPDFLIALQRETKKAQKLAHPNIVTVYDFDCDGDTFYMTMEYLVGQTLDEFIKKNRAQSLKKKTSLSIIEGMAQGLAYAHKNGIVHCDFKPGNVFLCKDGTVKILDFGIARAAKYPDKQSVDTTATMFDAGMFGALTPSYASCEMLEGDDPDPRDDIYALACVSYELLKGKHPYDKKKATVARNKHMKPDRVKGLSTQQWKGLLQGLAFKRKHRTASVDQFLHDINGTSRFLGLPRDWQLITGLTFALLIAGAFLLPDMLSPHVSNISETTSVSAEQQEKIARLLEAADVHLLIGRYTEPPGSNAYDAYKQILKINPQNQQAKAGLVKIADHYKVLAEESLERGDINTSLAMIEAGMKILPSHSGLYDLKQEISPDTSNWFRKAVNSIQHLF